MATILRSIKRLGFSQPTKIQKDTIPLILAGKDVIGESETGSGKTLAFGCGIIENSTREGGIQALVLTPTRELAEQVKDDLKEITFKPRLNIVAVYGGVSIYNQIKNLRRANVVVATPGRLLDHIQRGTIDLRDVNYLVMDEADRMFDMGFIDDVNKIIRECPQKRQTLFFSATISREVKKLANKHMESPETVLAGNIVDPDKLKQITINVSKNRKFSLLTHLLKEEQKPLAMVFCNTRHLSDFVDKNLRSQGIKAAAIHGGLTQNARLKAIDRFNSHEINVLVCTDVAARGLHIKNVSHVINYDLPQDPNDYIHRIGRTARAGESGQVINMLTNFDKNAMVKIKRHNKSFIMKTQEVPEFKEIRITRRINDVGEGRNPGKKQAGQNWKKNHNGGNGNGGGKRRSGQNWNKNDGGASNANAKKQWRSGKDKNGNYLPARKSNGPNKNQHSKGRKGQRNKSGKHNGHNHGGPKF